MFGHGGLPRRAHAGHGRRGGRRRAARRALRPHGHPEAAVQHRLPAHGPPARTSRTARGGRPLPDGAGLPQLRPHGPDRERVHERLLHEPPQRPHEDVGRGGHRPPRPAAPHLRRTADAGHGARRLHKGRAGGGWVRRAGRPPRDARHGQRLPRRPRARRPGRLHLVGHVVPPRRRERRADHDARLPGRELHERGRRLVPLPLPQEHHGPLDGPEHPPRTERRRLRGGQGARGLLDARRPRTGTHVLLRRPGGGREGRRRVHGHGGRERRALPRARLDDR